MERINGYWYPTDDWEFAVLGIYNYLKPGPFDYLFKFAERGEISGNYFESGVFRGRTLLSMALYLRRLGSSATVVGYDSFSGFPPSDREEDRLNNFQTLFETGKISREHFGAVERNYAWRTELSGADINPHNISLSGNFSDTSLDLIKSKIKLLELENVTLVDGPFIETMNTPAANSETLFGYGLLDCDLFESYRLSLDFVWPRLAPGGILFLDEYFSLKFPGGRIACDQFVELNKDAELELVSSHSGDFERWIMRKAATSGETLVEHEK